MHARRGPEEGTFLSCPRSKGSGASRRRSDHRGVAAVEVQSYAVDSPSRAASEGAAARFDGEASWCTLPEAQRLYSKRCPDRQLNILHESCPLPARRCRHVVAVEIYYISVLMISTGGLARPDLPPGSPRPHLASCYGQDLSVGGKASAMPPGMPRPRGLCCSSQVLNAGGQARPLLPGMQRQLDPHRY